jgi:hypothetical protein
MRYLYYLKQHMLLTKDIRYCTLAPRQFGPHLSRPRKYCDDGSAKPSPPLGTLALFSMARSVSVVGCDLAGPYFLVQSDRIRRGHSRKFSIRLEKGYKHNNESAHMWQPAVHTRKKNHFLRTRGREPSIKCHSDRFVPREYRFKALHAHRPSEELG